MAEILAPNRLSTVLRVDAYSDVAREVKRQLDTVNYLAELKTFDGPMTCWVRLRAWDMWSHSGETVRPLWKTDSILA